MLKSRMVDDTTAEGVETPAITTKYSRSEAVALLWMLVVSLVIYHCDATSEWNPNRDCHRLRQTCRLCDKFDTQRNIKGYSGHWNPSEWCHLVESECELEKYVKNDCKWPNQERRLGAILDNPTLYCHYILDNCTLCDYIQDGCVDEGKEWCKEFREL